MSIIYDGNMSDGKKSIKFKFEFGAFTMLRHYDISGT